MQQNSQLSVQLVVSCSEFFSFIKNMEIDLLVKFCELDFPSIHHQLHGLKCFVGLVGGKTGSSTPGKWRDKITWETATKDIGTYTHYCSRIKHGIDATFRMVAHDQSAKLQPGAQKPVFGIVPDLYFRIIVFKIGVIGIRTYITPLSNHRVSKKAVMPLVE